MPRPVEFYVDEDGEHRWRLRADNGEIIVPPEGHTEANDAIEAAERVRVHFAALGPIGRATTT